jgi:hypothetical protein
LVGTLLFVTRFQLAPELLLVYNPPLNTPATSFVQSELIATHFQNVLPPAPVDVQESP